MSNIYYNGMAYAAVKADGSVVTWGGRNPYGNMGADSSAVAERLSGRVSVKEIYTNTGTFLALMADGALVCWGSSTNGGDSSAVADKLNGTVAVVKVFTNGGAVAALRADGSLITWGSASSGADSSAIKDKLDGRVPVLKVWSSDYGSWAALRKDGSVVTWGATDYGDNGRDSSQVAPALDGQVDVVDIVTSGPAYAALRSDGSVITWGASTRGGDSLSVADALSGKVKVVKLVASHDGFAAIRADGSVIPWGDSSSVGNSSVVANALDGAVDVTQILAGYHDFAALRKDGSVVTWGRYQGTAPTTRLDGSLDVSKLTSNHSAFVALHTDGSITVWGDPARGGDAGNVAEKLNGAIDVVKIYPFDSAFAALRADGSLVMWGDVNAGIPAQNIIAPESIQLDGTIDVLDLVANGSAYAALRADGSVVTWGNKYSGGDSSAVATMLDGAIDVIKLFTDGNNFAALRVDGSVVTWGYNTVRGSLPSELAAKLDGSVDILEICPGQGAFAALRADGSIVTWGNQNQGGDSSAVAVQLSSGFALSQNHVPEGELVISGLAKQGEHLSVSSSVTDGDGLGKISFQWQADGQNIAGASTSSLTLGQDQVGKTISVVGSYVDGAGHAESIKSLASEPVANVDDPASGQLLISGTPREGQTLGASLVNGDDPDGALTSTSYQWQKNAGTSSLPEWQAIAGATAASLKLEPSQHFADADIRVLAKTLDVSGGSSQFTSHPVHVTSAADINSLPSGSVLIEGKARQGTVLTVNQNLADADGLGSIIYQWFSDSRPVPGANQTDYTLRPSDVGHQMTVMAMYTDDLGNDETIFSLPTECVVAIQSGVAQDGYLAHARVFVDANANGLCDWNDGNNDGVWSEGEGECWTLTDTTGQFSGLLGAGTLMSSGLADGSTLDISTGLPFRSSFSAPDGASTINPITTLLVVAELAGKTEADLKTSLGVDGAMSLANYDPILAASTTNPGSSSQKQAIKLQGVSLQIANIMVVASDMMRSLGAESTSMTEVSHQVAFTLLNQLASDGAKAFSDATVLSSVLRDVAALPVIDASAQSALLDQADAIADSLAAINDQLAEIAISASADTAEVNRILERMVAAQIVAQQTISAQASESVATGHPSLLTVNSANAKTAIDTAAALVQTAQIAVNHAHTGAIQIKGEAKQGESLCAISTLMDADGMSDLNYQWKADGNAIEGANSATLSLEQSLVGKQISLTASYTDGLVLTETSTDVLSQRVSNINDLPVGTLRIKGAARVGFTLSAENNFTDADGIGVISYQWRVQGREVSGATFSTFAVTDSMVGQPIALDISYVDGFGTSEVMSAKDQIVVGKLVSGSAKNDTISGSLGDDEIQGLAGNDSLQGLDGNDLINGGSGIDMITGGAGADTLDGGVGNDVLSGGAGDDTYIVDSKSDKVNESPGDSSGVDLVQTSLATYMLGNNLENLAYIGKSTFKGTGNELANILVGGPANDILDGKAGADTLQGGTGNDTYLIDNLFDQVVEETGQGQDIIQIAISNTQGSFILPLNVENAVLTSKVAFDLVGNELSNGLTGNDAANVLSGEAGQDSLSGGAGRDRLTGGAGADVLTGGKEADTFLFRQGDTGETMSTWDVITDFAKGKYGIGDCIDFTSDLVVGGSDQTATNNEASIHAQTGVASFAKGSGTTLTDALSDLTTRFTSAGDTVGEFAFFRVFGKGNHYLLISDGLPGVTQDDVLIQLTGVSGIKSIVLTEGNLGILS